jgi:hypothetical protein
MPKGIVRAADRVAVWHEAVDKFPSMSFGDGSESSENQPETSSPPAGGEAPAVSKSKKFISPANQLKKTLDTTAHPSQGFHPESTLAFKGWADKYPDFTKTYFKPDYADMLKAHVGEDNYAKLLHHAPTPYTDALTQHAQAPVPNSKKFTGPASSLKKLLDDPHTETDHVQQWLATPGGSAFAKTYLKPNYADALKGHLGEKNYNELQTHLNAPEKAQEHGLGAHYDQVVDALGKEHHTPEFQQWFAQHDQASQANLAQMPESALQWYQEDQAKKQPEQTQVSPHYQQLIDNIKPGSEAGNAIHSPQFKEWFHKFSPDLQVGMSKMPVSMYKTFAKSDLGKQWSAEQVSDQLEDDEDDSGSDYHQQNLADLAQIMHDQHGYHTPASTGGNAQDYQDWEDSLSPGEAQHYLENPQKAKESFEDHLNNYYADDHYDDLDPDGDEPDEEAIQQPGDQSEIDKIQQLLEPVHQQAVGADAPGSADVGLVKGIKKIFPKYTGDLENLSQNQAKGQLEQWLKHLPEHEQGGYSAHIPQLQALYDQHFGGGEQSPHAPGVTDQPLQDWEQQLWEQQLLPQQEQPVAHDTQAFSDDLSQIYNKTPGTSMKSHGTPVAEMTPEQQKSTIEELLQNQPDDVYAPKLKALLDKYSDQGQQQSAPAGDQGGPAPFDAHAIAQAMQEADPHTFDTDWVNGEASKKNPQEVLHHLQSLMVGNYPPEEKEHYQALLDKYFPNGEESAPAHQQQLAPAGGQQQPDHTFNPDESWQDPNGGGWKHNQGSLPLGLKTYAEENGIPLTDYAPWELQSLLNKGWGSLSPEEKQQYAAQQQGTQQQPSGSSDVDVAALSGDLDKIWNGGFHHDKVLPHMTPEQAKEGLQHYLDAHVKAQNEGTGGTHKVPQLQAVYDKYFGDVQQQPAGGGGSQAYDPQAAFEDWKKIYPTSTKQDEFADPEQAKDWVKQKIGLWQSTPDHPKVKQLQQFYDKWFGDGAQQNPVDNTPQQSVDVHALATELGNYNHIHPQHLHKGGQTYWDATPEQAKQMMQEVIDNPDLDNPEKKAFYQQMLDKHFGGAQPSFSSGISNTDQNTFGNQVPMGFMDGGYEANAPYKWAPGAQAWLAEHGVVNPEDVTYHNLADTGGGGGLHQQWINLSDAQKQHYIDMESGNAQQSPAGGTEPADPNKPPLEWMKKHYAGASNWTQEELDNWYDIHKSKDPADAAAALSAWQNDKHGDKTDYIGQQGASQQPVKPPFDWDTFGPEFKATFPNSSWANSPQDEASAQTKLQSAMEAANTSYPGSGKTKQINQLYQKWFGDSATSQTSGGGGLDEFFNKNFGEPEPPPEPAKPFKTESVKEEDLENWAANKPSSPADWKNFASWWGNTQLAPEQEQGLYNYWFGKNATPEQAQQWFQSVFEHNSAPSDADLGASFVPSWAHNTWAFGNNADAEWPVFQAWAAKHPGIPKGTSIKQKVAIWNSLSDEDKSQIAGDYLPSDPIDTKNVLKSLKAAYPDSDWSKWSKMTQGTLGKNLQSLAEKGYAGAIPIYNQFFGGNVPMPEEHPEEDQEQEASDQEKPLPPPESLPEWVQPQLAGKSPGMVAKLTKDYLSMAHFADSVGQGESVTGAEKPKELGKVWQNLPPHIKAQIDQMSQPPWNDLDGFNEWKEAQPTVSDAIKAVLGSDNLSYYPWGYEGGYDSQKQQALGKLIDKADDPETKQKLLGIQHQFFGHGKTTLAESLNQALPGQDWDKLLQTKTKSQVASLLKKQFKTEQDPVKWAQLANVWSKHFAHPDKSGDVAPTGVKALNDFFKYLYPGKQLSADQLSKAIGYKAKNPNNESDYMGYYTEEANTQAAKEMAAADDGKSFLPFHGWTPPSGTGGSLPSYTPDPAQLGKSEHATYTAPEEGPKGKQYQELMQRVDTLAPGLFSAKDKATLKSDSFSAWFEKAPLGYRQQMRDNPGVALDDFEHFMSGGQPYPGGHDGPVPKNDKYIDVSPFANTPKRDKAKGIPDSHTHNSPRADDIKFPRKQDQQETLPLGPGERFAPDYAAMPIYRVMRLNLGEDPERVPGWVKPQDKRLHIQQQRARLQRIDEILNGKSKARNPKSDMAEFDTFATNHGLDEKAKVELAAQLFTTKQPDLFTDDKWAHFEQFAQKHGINPAEMHDLAKKMEVSPPVDGEPKGNYDHPELANLILDYFENGGGIGNHWTRDVDKAYEGVPAAGSGAETSNPTHKSIPVSFSGLWGGQGEGGGSGLGTGGSGVYGPHDKRELEHNLRDKAPVNIRRLQIRSPDNDWHDLIDHGPISQWDPGRNESACGPGMKWSPSSEKCVPASGKLAPIDKPSLARNLDKVLGGSHSPKEWDTLKPGHQADAVFSKLIAEHPHKEKELLKEWQRFFVGRPDLPTKPHVRRASLSLNVPALRIASTPEGLDERNPAHLFDLATSWGVPNPERYGVPQSRRERAKEFLQDLNGVGYAWKSMVRQHGFGIPVQRQSSLDAIEAAIMRLADYRDDEDYDPDYDDSVYDDDEDNEYSDDDFTDPPLPSGDRPAGWPRHAPFLRRDPRNRQYFPPHGLNPESTSPARPSTEWDETEPDHEMLPIEDAHDQLHSGLGGWDRFHQDFEQPTNLHFLEWLHNKGIDPAHPDFSPEGTFKNGPYSTTNWAGLADQYRAQGPQPYEWPHDREPMPMYRGLMLHLNHDQSGTDPLGPLRRSLYGDQYELLGKDGTGGKTSPQMGDKALAKAHPMGFDNPALGEFILNHVQNNPKGHYEDQKGYGLGPHWSQNRSTAMDFSSQTTGGGRGPLQLPVVVRSQWKGTGEDPYRTNTQGDWPEENEVTMLPGAKMNIDSVQIQHPKAKSWHEVLDKPTEKHAATYYHRTVVPFGNERPEHASPHSYFYTTESGDPHDVDWETRAYGDHVYQADLPENVMEADPAPRRTPGAKWWRTDPANVGEMTHIHDPTAPFGVPSKARKRGGILTHSEMRR